MTGNCCLCPRLYYTIFIKYCPLSLHTLGLYQEAQNLPASDIDFVAEKTPVFLDHLTRPGVVGIARDEGFLNSQLPRLIKRHPEDFLTVPHPLRARTDEKPYVSADLLELVVQAVADVHMADERCSVNEPVRGRGHPIIGNVDALAVADRLFDVPADIGDRALCIPETVHAVLFEFLERLSETGFVVRRRLNEFHRKERKYR